MGNVQYHSAKDTWVAIMVRKQLVLLYPYIWTKHLISYDFHLNCSFRTSPAWCSTERSWWWNHDCPSWQFPSSGKPRLLFHTMQKPANFTLNEHFALEHGHRKKMKSTKINGLLLNMAIEISNMLWYLPTPNGDFPWVPGFPTVTLPWQRQKKPNGPPQRGPLSSPVADPGRRCRRPGSSKFRQRNRRRIMGCVVICVYTHIYIYVYNYVYI